MIDTKYNIYMHIIYIYISDYSETVKSLLVVYSNGVRHIQYIMTQMLFSFERFDRGCSPSDRSWTFHGSRTPSLCILWCIIKPGTNSKGLYDPQ
jgi:hypothetical protein